VRRHEPHFRNAGRNMRIGARQRWLVLFSLLALALSAAAWVREGSRAEEEQTTEVQGRATRPANAGRSQAVQSVERVQLEKMHSHRADADRAADAFAPRTWRKPAPKAAAPATVAAAAPAPTAPPLPFVYIGKIQSEEISVVFLAQGERNLAVHEGEVIDGIYRVDTLSEAGLTLTHLPTGTRQNLMIGEPQ
jgi:hypothetical protein